MHEDNITDYTVSERNGIYTVEVGGKLLEGLKKGDKLVLPATDNYPEGIALIVSSNKLSSNAGNRTITGTIPDEMTEFVEAVDIEGFANVKADEVTAVDGVATVNVVAAGANYGNITTMAKADGEVDLKEQVNVSYTVKEINTTVSFYISSLKYSVNFDKKGVNKLYIGLPSVLSLETDYKASKNFSKKIGDIPIELAAGFSANIEVYLEIDISGQIKLNFKLANNIGMHYYNGNFYTEKSCNPDFEAVVDADIDAGAKLQLGLYWMKGIMDVFGKEDPRPVYNLYTKWGLHGDATLRTRNDQYTSNKKLVCVDLGYYLYGNINAGNGSFLGDKFNLKYERIIFDDKNSPLKGDLHIENGEIVHSCTYKVPVKAVLEDYAKQFTYLCSDTKTYEVYASYEESIEDFKMSDNIPNKPLTCNIDDYDNDGVEELLVANTEFYIGNTSKVIRFEMYEVENEGVIKKAVSDYKFQEDCYSSLYDSISEISTWMYKYRKDDSKVIALEQHIFNVLGGDYLVQFKALRYNGKDFENIGANVHAMHGGPWGVNEQYLQEVKGDYDNLGINVNAEELLNGEKSIYDYIDNLYIFGRLNTIMTEDIETLFENPSLRYKISDVRFAVN